MTAPSPHEVPEYLQRSRWSLLTLVAVAVTSAVIFSDFLPGRGPGRAVAAEAGPTMSQDEFDRRVHDYLIAHPEVISEAISRLETRQREDEAKQARGVLKQHGDQVFHDPNDPVSGNPSGDVTLVEFFDYNCPYCKRMASIMTQAEKADARLRIVYKEFPILGPNSVFAAKVALAANKQGKYVAFHRALYDLRGPVDEAKVLVAAKAVGLDVARLKADTQAPEIGAHLEKNIKLAESLGITGTPGFIIGDQIVTGATDFEGLQALIARGRSNDQEAK
jgi:protein-disulfide isomerase